MKKGQEMAEHIKDIDIVSFRGIDSLQLHDLQPVNILTGDNNCGKTSVLEVLESFEEPGSFRAWRSLLRKESTGLFPERFSYYEGFCDLFDVNREEKRLEYTIRTGKDKETHVALTAQEDEDELTEEEYRNLIGFSASRAARYNKESSILTVSRLLLEVRLNGVLASRDFVYDGQRRFKNTASFRSEAGIRTLSKKVIYISPIRHAEGLVFLSSILSQPDLYEDMLSVLKEYDKDIISINYDRDEKSLSGRGVYKILSKSHKRALPLNVYGDGMKKAILLMSAVIKAAGGILLLDEFETAIHTSAMDRTFRWILETCIKLDVQVFLTSHSKEAIEKVLKCAPELQGKMAVYTLYKENERTAARRLTGEKAIVVQEDMGLELR